MVKWKKLVNVKSHNSFHARNIYISAWKELCKLSNITCHDCYGDKLFYLLITWSE